MIENFSSVAMTGLALFGGAMQLRSQGDVSAAVGIISGDYDRELLAALLLKFSDVPNGVTEEAMTTQIIQNKLETLKDQVRWNLQRAIREEEQDRKELDRLNLAALQENLKETNKPHEMGTVNEIAQKYGISKSEVRRRKQEGTLHELVSCEVVVK